MPGKHAPQPLQTLIPPVMGSMLEFTEITYLRRGDTHRFLVEPARLITG